MKVLLLIATLVAISNCLPLNEEPNRSRPSEVKLNPHREHQSPNERNSQLAAGTPPLSSSQRHSRDTHTNTPLSKSQSTDTNQHPSNSQSKTEPKKEEILQLQSSQQQGSQARHARDTSGPLAAARVEETKQDSNKRLPVSSIQRTVGGSTSTERTTSQNDQKQPQASGSPRSTRDTQQQPSNPAVKIEQVKSPSQKEEPNKNKPESFKPLTVNRRDTPAGSPQGKSPYNPDPSKKVNQYASVGHPQTNPSSPATSQEQRQVRDDHSHPHPHPHEGTPDKDDKKKDKRDTQSQPPASKSRPEAEIEKDIQSNEQKLRSQGTSQSPSNQRAVREASPDHSHDHNHKHSSEEKDSAEEPDSAEKKKKNERGRRSSDSSEEKDSAEEPDSAEKNERKVRDTQDSVGRSLEGSSTQGLGSSTTVRPVLYGQSRGGESSIPGATGNKDSLAVGHLH